MKRDVAFIVNDDPKGPHFDARAERWTPGLEIQVRFSIYREHSYARMRIDFVEETIGGWNGDGSLASTLRRVAHEESVMLKEYQDVALAAACLSCDDKLAVDIVHNLFWRLVIVPSMKTDGEMHWLCKHAPEYWHAMARAGGFFKDKEQECQNVQDA